MIPILLESQIRERRYEHEKLVVTENISLDSVIDANEGWFARTHYGTND